MTELATDNAPTVTHTKVREARRTATLRHATYLTGSIPKLQPHCPVLEVHGFAQEVNAYRGLVCIVERVVHESARATGTRVDIGSAHAEAPLRRKHGGDCIGRTL